MARGLHRHGIAGMNGVKQLMVFHAPLCIAAAILLVLALHDSGTSDWKTALQHCRRQVRLFAASLVTAVAGAAGYFISNSVMSRLYDSSPTASSSGTATRTGSRWTAS